MLTEARLILPVFDNDGNSLGKIHDRLATELCDRYKGYTAYTGYGGWKEGDKVVHEPVEIYDVAIPEDQAFLFRGLAVKYGKLAGQKAVYVLTFGKVQIIDLED